MSDPSELVERLREIFGVANMVEVERLRCWVYCPAHGPHCGGSECCCADEHQPYLAAGESDPRFAKPSHALRSLGLDGSDCTCVYAHVGRIDDADCACHGRRVADEVDEAQR